MHHAPLMHGLLTAISVALVLCLLHRAGPRASGLAAAIPITSMPALVWLSWDQGAAPAAAAAGAAMMTTAWTGAFAVAYARQARRAGPWRAFAGAILPTLAAAGASAVSADLASMAVVAAALLAASARLLPTVAGGEPPKGRRHGLLKASIVAGGVTALVGLIAPGVSPAICGLVSAIPVVGVCSIVTVHKHDGSAALLTFMRGYVRGLWAKAVFYGVLACALPEVAGASAWLAASVMGLAIVLFTASRRFNVSGLGGSGSAPRLQAVGKRRTAPVPVSGRGSLVSGWVRWARACFVGMLGFTLLLSNEGCRAADRSWSIEPYYYLLHWAGMRRFDLVIEQFADDAVVVSGPGCPLTDPRVGKTAIRQGFLAALELWRASLPLAERFDGERLTTNAEAVRAHGSAQNRRIVPMPC